MWLFSFQYAFDILNPFHKGANWIFLSLHQDRLKVLVGLENEWINCVNRQRVRRCSQFLCCHVRERLCCHVSFLILLPSLSLCFLRHYKLNGSMIVRSTFQRPPPQKITEWRISALACLPLHSSISSLCYSQRMRSAQAYLSDDGCSEIVGSVRGLSAAMGRMGREEAVCPY